MEQRPDRPGDNAGDSEPHERDCRDHPAQPGGARALLLPAGGIASRDAGVDELAHRAKVLLGTVAARPSRGGVAAPADRALQGRCRQQGLAVSPTACSLSEATVCEDELGLLLDPADGAVPLAEQALVADVED